MILHELVIDAARRDPDALAVVSGEDALSYGQLDAQADRYAAALRSRGVRPGDRVLIWGGKSTAAVALMQGALRAGAIYVPVAATNPAVRVATIARDCAAALIAMDGSVTAYLPQVAGGPRSAGAPLVTLEELLAEAEAEAGAGAGQPPYPASPDEPAYILYTSGSTGTPKGVAISHANALAFVRWAAELLELGPQDRLSNHAPFNFDLSVFDLYGAFLAGASVRLVPPELAYTPLQLAEFLVAARITVWYSVPSALVLMMRDGGLLDRPQPPDLRACVFAGEPFALARVQALRKHWPTVRLLNWYGPTETNVCTSYEVTDADLARTGPLPIGTAASGDTVTLDPPGEGEIVVSGPTTMLGYWGGPAHHGPYRTGDFGRLGADGELEYVGRIDHLVKVRGQRVELGEIENVLATHAGVSAVAVLVVGSGLEAELHAVVVPAEGGRPRLLDLKAYSAERMPTYMIPDALHLTDALPLTPNGKVDRPALLAAIERGGL
ncbi:AMP-binding protein [Kitasatospora sp. SUK 42]|uniref:AMP-binding protein n=1 Tax=Kitasatospora sp. SUK 42 TaxID=1588882 RepID=UPI001C31CD33|nr:AMP-binding protein [Kitasatospora sp. SUK 42]MBV2156569.1 AMP-binding protein [Kitasatospora sp. SUK 42]